MKFLSSSVKYILGKNTYHTDDILKLFSNSVGLVISKEFLSNLFQYVLIIFNVSDVFLLYHTYDFEVVIQYLSLDTSQE